MNNYWNLFVEGYTGYASYLWSEVMQPSWSSYFYWLIVVSLFFFSLEVVIPWRKKQAIFRRDFFLDAFYMFFNFFLFSLVIYNAASDVIVSLFNDGIKWMTGGFDLQSMNPMSNFPLWSILLIGFVVRDFVQWWIHRLLHTSEKLWRFHKVHHSVQEMGFAAHLRYHWMENVIYRTLEYIPLALLGIGLYDFFVIHIFTLAWGHYNHANISIDKRITGGIVGCLVGVVIAYSLLDVTIIDAGNAYHKIGIISACTIIGVLFLGKVMKYIFNSPELHIWHHAQSLPSDRRNGVNFALTLAIWDYIFKTSYLPYDGKEIPLGFDDVENYPSNFLKQNTSGF